MTHQRPINDASTTDQRPINDLAWSMWAMMGDDYSMTGGRGKQIERY